MAPSSSASVEIELKYSLSKSEYSKLNTFLKKFSHRTENQINHYFDSPSLGLRKKRIGLRIRTKGKRKAILTLKFPKPSSKNGPKSLKVRYEYEEEIPLRTAQAILKGKAKISELNIRPVVILKSKIGPKLANSLILLGALSTDRTVYRYSKDFNLELDCYSLFGKVFYELEVETSSPIEVDIQIKELLKKAKTQYKPSEISKLQRFLSEWIKQKNRA